MPTNNKPGFKGATFNSEDTATCVVSLNNLLSSTFLKFSLVFCKVDILCCKLFVFKFAIVKFACLSIIGSFIGSFSLKCILLNSSACFIGASSILSVIWVLFCVV